MSLNDTPRSNRLHIGIFGKVNSGKSTFLNMLTAQESALVSSQEGTTTDPIYKAMELAGIGPVVFIDTAGFEDTSALGEKRLEKTKEAAMKTDIALVLFADADIQMGLSWIRYFQEHNTIVLPIMNTINNKNLEESMRQLKKHCGIEPLYFDVKEESNRDMVRQQLIRCIPESHEMESITGNLVKKEDCVLLVMPQDIQAPKGRLILPQVQTLRELLDKNCVVVSCSVDQMEKSLQALKQAPDVIICDSQIFDIVYKKKPQASKLTSFSVLFAHYKGDIFTFMQGAKAIESLKETSHVLIAEACTHAPLSEDIGRKKIPVLLKKKIGENLKVSIVSGSDFPKNLKDYDLIIHCGGCMFNRKYVLERINAAKEANIPITNYGVCLAYLKEILDKIDLL